MKKYFSTLDIGTSTIKGMIWDDSGHCHFQYYESSPLLKLEGFFAEQDINQFYKKILKTLQHLDAAVSFKECVCLAISTQRDTLIAMDNSCELTALISWL